MCKEVNNTIYLVTGAAGFLGSHVCSELLDRGDRVRALVLPKDPATKYIPSQVEVVEGNLCDKDSLEPFYAMPKGAESVVIHCASMVTTNPDFNQKLIDVNVGGTENIIEKCLEHKECRKMVYVSSTGAIPELPKGEKIKEAKRFTPIDEKRQVGCYSQSKALATQAVLDACKKKGLKACVVHPSGILGPDDHAISETTGTIIKIMNGEMTVGMGGSFNLCDVRDLAHGCVGAADKGRIGECYILGNDEVTLKEVCKMLNDACGCKMPYFYVPIKMAYMLAAQMEKKAEKTGEKPLMTNFAVYNLARNNAFDYTKAKKELGYHTRPYVETLTDEARWLVEEGYIKGVSMSTPAETEARIEKGVLTNEEVTNVQRLISARQFIKEVGAVQSAAKLDGLVLKHGIKGYTKDMLKECYACISLSQDRDALRTILKDTDPGSICSRMAAYGIDATAEMAGLLCDIAHIGQDETLLKSVLSEKSVVRVTEQLHENGYQAINASFLEMLRENAGSLVEDGMLMMEDIRDFSGRDFFERCDNALNTLVSMGTVIELALHLQDAVNPVYMIAIAGNIALLYSVA